MSSRSSVCSKSASTGRRPAPRARPRRRGVADRLQLHAPGTLERAQVRRAHAAGAHEREAGHQAPLGRDARRPAETGSRSGRRRHAGRPLGSWGGDLRRRLPARTASAAGTGHGAPRRARRAPGRADGISYAAHCNVPGRTRGYRQGAPAHRADRGRSRRPGRARALPLGRARALRPRRAGRSVRGGARGRGRSLRHPGAPRLARRPARPRARRDRRSAFPMRFTPISPAAGSRRGCTCCARSPWRSRSRSATASPPPATPPAACSRSGR